MKVIRRVAGIIIVIASLMLVNWSCVDLSRSKVDAKEGNPDTLTEVQMTEVPEVATNLSEMGIDTVMYAKGHAFGYKGDISWWGGWYLDTVYLGDDRMLRYDSINPSSLKLSLVTKELIVDLGDDGAIDKIKGFIKPAPGFKQFRKCYETCLDTVKCREFGYDRTTGRFSFKVDYPDGGLKDAEKIFGAICKLATIPGAGMAYKGRTDDMPGLADFLADRIFGNWSMSGDYAAGSNQVDMSLKTHVVNERYVTFSKYEYNREGIGHGMYAETFHTFDLKTGRELKNTDIFKKEYLDKVKMELFRVMASDVRYGSRYGDSESHQDIQLPDGALAEKGIIFSFQPYEIDSWAAGSYHFIVPYGRLMPYLTSGVKKLI